MLEVSQLLGAPIRLTTGQKLAAVYRVIIDGQDARIAGFQTTARALLRRFGALEYSDALYVRRDEITTDDTKSIQNNLKPFDLLRRQYGAVLNVAAKTESGRRLGRIHDLAIDAESGLIVRFYVGQLLRERIIPRQFLVSISPKQVIFKEIVGQPLFDQIAVGQITA